MSRAKGLVLPGYLLLCLVLGGSTQGMWGNALLQLLALAILGWAIFTPDPQPVSLAGRRLLLIAGAAALLILVQMVPLPPAAWTALPGRDFVESGFRLIGVPLPWMPISLAPYDTLATALTLLPPLALLVGMLRLRTWTASGMFAAVIAGAAISILLGALQVSGGEDRSWYFYRRTNTGLAVGTFANANHFATLLLATIPLLAAMATARWRSARQQQQRSLTAALALGAAAVLAIGILVNRSTAMLLLGLPVAAATAMLAIRLSQRRMVQGLAAVGLLLLVTAGAVLVVGKDVPGWGTRASIETRTEYWSTSRRLAEDQLLTGSGVGTFEQAYRRYEDSASVDRWYVNHAHNDYLELAVEGGVAALILLLAFLLWWAGRAREAWLSPAALDEKAAAVASAAILLHSLFDYPLRTAAIAGIFAVCLALLAGARGAVRQDAFDESERPRHATL